MFNFPKAESAESASIAWISEFSSSSDLLDQHVEDQSRDRFEGDRTGPITLKGSNGDGRLVEDTGAVGATHGTVEPAESKFRIFRHIKELTNLGMGEEKRSPDFKNAS